MPTGSKVPPDTQREVVRLYVDELLTFEEIGERVFWSQSTVRRIVIAHGHQPRRSNAPREPYRPVYSEEHIELFAEWYRGGMSANEIARRMNTTHSAITYHLKRSGVEMRSRGQARGIHKRRRITVLGAAGLEDHQRRVFELIERDGKITTRQIAIELGWTPQRTRQVLVQVERYGLIRARSLKVGKGRPKMWQRTRLSTRDVLDARFSTERPTGDTYLPLAPFLHWVDRLIDREERKSRMGLVAKSPRDEGSRDGHTMPVVDALCSRMRMDSRRLLALRHDQQRISLTVADRALAGIDDGTRLEDLWPDELGRIAVLFEGEEAQAA